MHRCTSMQKGYGPCRKYWNWTHVSASESIRRTFTCAHHAHICKNMYIHTHTHTHTLIHARYHVHKYVSFTCKQTCEYPNGLLHAFTLTCNTHFRVCNTYIFSRQSKFQDTAQYETCFQSAETRTSWACGAAYKCLFESKLLCPRYVSLYNTHASTCKYSFCYVSGYSHHRFRLTALQQHASTPVCRYSFTQNIWFIWL
jgi:hypothetical protein